MDKYEMMKTTEHGLRVLNIHEGYIWANGTVEEKEIGQFCMSPNLNTYQEDAVLQLRLALEEDMEYLSWRQRNSSDSMSSYQLEWMGNIHKIMEQIASIRPVKEPYPPIEVFRNPPNCMRRYLTSDDDNRDYTYTLSGYGLRYLHSMLERYEEQSPLLIGLVTKGGGRDTMVDMFKKEFNLDTLGSQFRYLPEVPWHRPPVNYTEVTVGSLPY